MLVSNNLISKDGVTKFIMPFAIAPVSFGTIFILICGILVKKEQDLGGKEQDFNEWNFYSGSHEKTF